MSVEVRVYLRNDKLPTYDEWQHAIEKFGFDLKFDHFTPREHTGFVPVIMNGKSCGFEFFFGSIDDEPDEVLDQIGDRDCVVSFVLHGSLEDLKAANLASTVLTKISDGVFFDPQSGEFAKASNVFELLQRDAETLREHRKRQAEKYAATTDLRCPKCNAPCPSYRKTCKACGFEVGRSL